MGQDLNNILEQQLRDVHLPGDVSWWPLAIGWWLVLGLTLIGITALLVYLLRQRRLKRYRKAAQVELQSIYADWQSKQDTAAYLQSANAILKRCVLHFDSTSIAAGITGKQWVTMLNGYIRKTLTTETQNALADDCYRPMPTADVDSVHQELKAWIGSHQQSVSEPPATPAKNNEARHA